MRSCLRRRGRTLARNRTHLSKTTVKIQKKGRWPTPALRSANGTYRTANKYDWHTCVARAFSSFPRPSSQTQKSGRTRGGACLFLIARRGPIFRAVAPITRTLNKPFETRVFGDPLKHPDEVIAIIRRKTEFGSVGHNCCQGIEGLAGHEAAILVAPLWPRVRKQDKDAIDR
jgi:hypothetical protein